MVNVFVKGKNDQIELLTQKYEQTNIEIPNQWISGGGGNSNGHLNLYGFQDNRIRSPFIPIKSNQTYDFSISNLRDKNFYFNYYVLKSDKSTVTLNSFDWIRNKKAISIKTTADAKYLLILVGSDDCKFGPEAINTLVQVNLSGLQAVRYVKETEFNALKSEFNALKNKIGGVTSHLYTALCGVLATSTKMMEVA